MNPYDDNALQISGRLVAVETLVSVMLAGLGRPQGTAILARVQGVLSHLESETRKGMTEMEGRTVTALFEVARTDIDVIRRNAAQDWDRQA